MLDLKFAVSCAFFLAVLWPAMAGAYTLPSACDADFTEEGNMAPPGENGSLMAGMCITSASRNDGSIHRDVACFDRIVGGASEGIYTFFLKTAAQCGEDVFETTVNTYSTQSPTIVFDTSFDSNPLLYAGLLSCNCTCPIPDRLDGGSINTADWHLETAWLNFSLNAEHWIHGANAPEQVWTSDTRNFYQGWVPNITFDGGNGADQMVMYGTTRDCYSEGGNFISHDVIWADVGATGGGAQFGFELGAGNDDYWGPSGKAVGIPGCNFKDMGTSGGDNDRTDAPAQVINEEQAMGPPAAPLCPSWIQYNVQNGLWPGMQ